MTEKTHRQQRKKNPLERLLSSINFLVSEDTKTVDERVAPRIECRAEVAFVDENGGKGIGYLVDVSKTGLQLETSSRLGKGLTIALNAPEGKELERTAPFMAKVRWTKKGADGMHRVGLALPPGVEEDPHWLEALLNQLGYVEEGSQRRRFIRSDAELTGELSPMADVGETVPVVVLNLGMGGALLRVEEPLAKNLQFKLTIGPYQDLPSVLVEGTILRSIEKSDEEYTLHPSRFNAAGERDSNILKEYILKLSDRSGEPEA